MYIEIWRGLAKVDAEGTGLGGVEATLTKLVELDLTRTLHLEVGDTIELGREGQRLDQTSARPTPRVDIGNDTGISKVALTVEYRQPGSANLRITQLSGVYVQEWGTAGGTQREGALTVKGPAPTSLRIDCSRHRTYYWVLLDLSDDYNVDGRPLPTNDHRVEREPHSNDPEKTDERPSGRFLPGSAAYKALQEASDALRNYYHDYLRWPPPLQPKVRAGDGARLIRKCRKEAAAYGYPADTPHGRETEFISWLIREGNMPFEDYRVHPHMQTKS